ncbi:MAG: hypothetical protein HYV65_00230 [Candidatus Spechtbacteria bacterium]|nr:hypothetical protein [Candidatus Spechtbacteria bacterium]
MSIGNNKIFYLALDPERATGVEDDLANYAIICPYKSAFTDDLEARGTKMFILERDCVDKNWEDNLRAGTYGVAKLTCVIKYIDDLSAGQQSNILVLKTSEPIEQECQKNSWQLMAPRADLATLFEDKITQYQHLKDSIEFPPTIITTLSQATKVIAKMPLPLVAQYNIGHSGGGTFILQSIEDLTPHAEKFPNREVRIAQFITGNTYTLNAFAAKNGTVYTGSISKQLTGLPEATNNPSSTVGNDFGIVSEELSQSQIEAIGVMARNVGTAMHAKGYNGLFGIDAVAEKSTGKVYFIEVNTHQPASISFEAKLHRAINKTPLILLFINDMLEPGFEPKKELALSLSNGDLPPLVLRGKVRQVLYRNKLQNEVLVSEIQLPLGEGIVTSRMKVVGVNEELYRVQEYIINE